MSTPGEAPEAAKSEEKFDVYKYLPNYPYYRSGQELRAFFAAAREHPEGRRRFMDDDSYYSQPKFGFLDHFHDVDDKPVQPLMTYLVLRGLLNTPEKIKKAGNLESVPSTTTATVDSSTNNESVQVCCIPVEVRFELEAKTPMERIGVNVDGVGRGAYFVPGNSNM
ncbi:hypothetical protein L228DRAFT_280122 [Xylona heveae TC161]|uniref:Uncharacterized protein n=1 Tax=Xylona heveae (strain CBS 132557 / TC161) TaxID=1328760 RepID=A0A165IFC0_XYLHT|nr:hypothetical protein L228DRAFT_280122 [Xylona heveae TC161]KZF24819.1 hypothetical protein L228DRAFT_280122 [Xylona heveae TC161]